MLNDKPTNFYFVKLKESNISYVVEGFGVNDRYSAHSFLLGRVLHSRFFGGAWAPVEESEKHMLWAFNPDLYEYQIIIKNKRRSIPKLPEEFSFII